MTTGRTSETTSADCDQRWGYVAECARDWLSEKNPPGRQGAEALRERYDCFCSDRTIP